MSVNKAIYTRKGQGASRQQPRAWPFTSICGQDKAPHIDIIWERV